MTDQDFVLHPRLASDTILLGELGLSSVLLMDDARFPWFVLVPRRPDLNEVTDLSSADAATLMEEIRISARVMQALAKPDTVNVGLVGNEMLPFHAHVVGRFRSDPAWPDPVWGFGASAPYPAHAAAALSEQAAALFAAA